MQTTNAISARATIRRAVARAVLHVARPAHDAETDPLRGRPLRVLFIHEGAPEELILSLGAVRAIAGAYPGTIVDIVTASDNEELLQSLPYVNDVITFPRHDGNALAAAFAIRRRRPYDVVVDGAIGAREVASRSVALMLASRAPYWLGETGRVRDEVFNVDTPPADPSLSNAMRTLRLVSPLLRENVEADPRPKLALDDIERGWAASYWGRGWARSLRILIDVSADVPERRWPTERFAIVLDHLRRRAPHATMIVAGLPHRASEVEVLAPRADALLFAPSIRQKMALAASADLVFTSDATTAQIASAFRRMLVSMHLRGAEATAPIASPGITIFASDRHSLLPITIERAVSALDEVLDFVKGGTSAMARSAS